MSKRFFFYTKFSEKPIVITDEDCEDDVNTIKDSIINNILSNNGVCSFITDKDMLIFKSSDIGPIHIQNLGNESFVSNDSDNTKSNRSDKNKIEEIYIDDDEEEIDLEDEDQQDIDSDEESINLDIDDEEIERLSSEING